jgi:hypothetical protein
MKSLAVLEPPTGRSCDFATIIVVRCDFNGQGLALFSESTEPNEDGWCHYLALDIAEEDHSMCMTIETTMVGKETALIDEVSLLPKTSAGKTRQMKPLSSSRQERFRRIAKKVRDMTPVGEPPKRLELAVSGESCFAMRTSITR